MKDIMMFRGWDYAHEEDNALINITLNLSNKNHVSR